MSILLKFTALTLSAILLSNTEVTNPSEIYVTDNITGSLIIFHAGSLSVPVKQITEAFKKENPEIKIITEAAGSLECARKITELKKPCDVMISADYNVIDKILIPDYAGWSIKFASNEMAIVYTGRSGRSNEINKNNWHKILLDAKIKTGRSDPDSDPCGYRAVQVMKLAEKYYKIQGLADKLIMKDRNNIRPKETDLLALLESDEIDYIFLYRSVAEQHKLKYLPLPDSINLKNPALSEFYAAVSVEIKGKKPGEKIIQIGEPMVYGITMPRNAPDNKAALAFVKFFLTSGKGMAILEKCGQSSVIPSSTNSYDKIPEELRLFAKK